MHVQSLKKSIRKNECAWQQIDTFNTEVPAE